ncbi:hypothetical protein QVD17_36880 [Tagetes erecta]|uniref:Uncharacterized protein n=1 Tax=Tagetes erecta TaxID=13708 RepID=A0AAD8JT38_TARER|nr:hypothetical protein QVD17_36880 [Tagetes erecta]
MFKSPRRNGRNKGLRMKHVIQMSMLLGVSIWLLYQIHNSDGKKSSVTTNISYKLLNNSDGSKDIFKLGRKVLRPKVKETKEHIDGEEKNENEGSDDVVEDRESDEHEEVGENGRADGKEDGEEMKEHENENEFDEEIKLKLNENTRNEQNEKKMNPNLKGVGKSVASDDIDDGDGDDDQSVRGEVENDKISVEQPSVDHNEHGSKNKTAQQMNYAPDSDSHKTITAKFVISTGNENTTNVKTEFEQKDDGSVLEEEKDALTDLETLPEGGTGGSITHENVATE